MPLIYDPSLTASFTVQTEVKYQVLTRPPPRAALFIRLRLKEENLFARLILQLVHQARHLILGRDDKGVCVLPAAG